MIEWYREKIHDKDKQGRIQRGPIMIQALENIPETDPLAIPHQKAIIDQILEDSRNIPGAPMVVLNELQSRIGHISIPMQAYVAKKLRVPMSQINGVVSFYSFFTTHPRGKHTLKFCLGTACYVRGAPKLIEKAEQPLGIHVGQTTEDGEVTLEVCRCLGACSQAPVIVVDGSLRGRMQPNQMPQVIHHCTGNGHHSST
jgi:NADH:ubiquinone oxidoreductase subunit E